MERTTPHTRGGITRRCRLGACSLLVENSLNGQIKWQHARKCFITETLYQAESLCTLGLDAQHADQMPAEINDRHMQLGKNYIGNAPRQFLPTLSSSSLHVKLVFQDALPIVYLKVSAVREIIGRARVVGDRGVLLEEVAYAVDGVPLERHAIAPFGRRGRRSPQTRFRSWT